MLKKLSVMVKHSELPRYSGCGITLTDRLIAAREFPAGIPMTSNGKQIRWAEEELLAWQNGRLAIRDDPVAMRARTEKMKAYFTPKVEKERTRTKRRSA